MKPIGIGVRSIAAASVGRIAAGGFRACKRCRPDASQLLRNERTHVVVRRGIEHPIPYNPWFRTNNYKSMIRVYGQAEADRNIVRYGLLGDGPGVGVGDGDGPGSDGVDDGPGSEEEA